MTLCNSRGEDMVALARRIASETGALALVRDSPPRVHLYAPAYDGGQGNLVGVYYSGEQWERTAGQVAAGMGAGPHPLRIAPMAGAYIDAGDSEGGAP